MKNAKYIIIAIACICLLCGGFYLFTNDNPTGEKELTEVEKIIVKDLDGSYPKTPREVIKFYNRIIECYYGNTEVTDAQLEKLVDQMLCLLDEELRQVNPKDEYLRSVIADRAQYDREKKVVVNSDVCDSNDVQYIDDEKEGSTEVDKLAYVNTSYFINTDGSFAYTYQQFVLRQDDNGKWKILAFYEVEGDSAEDD